MAPVNPPRPLINGRKNFIQLDLFSPRAGTLPPAPPLPPPHQEQPAAPGAGSVGSALVPHVLDRARAFSASTPSARTLRESPCPICARGALQPHRPNRLREQLQDSPGSVPTWHGPAAGQDGARLRRRRSKGRSQVGIGRDGIRSRHRASRDPTQGFGPSDHAGNHGAIIHPAT